MSANDSVFVWRESHSLLHYLLTTLDRLNEVQDSWAVHSMLFFTKDEVDSLEHALSDHSSFDLEEIADALAAASKSSVNQQALLWRYAQMRLLKEVAPEFFAKVVAYKPEREGELKEAAE